MFDLPSYFIVLVTLNVPILDRFLVQHLDMDGRTPILELLFLCEELSEGSTDGYHVVGCIDHKVELLLADGALADPRGAEFVEVFLDLTMFDDL